MYLQCSQGATRGATSMLVKPRERGASEIARVGRGLERWTSKLDPCNWGLPSHSPVLEMCLLLSLPTPGCYFCSVPQSCLTLCNPWTTVYQAFLSFTISRSLLKLMSIESVMPFNRLILCHPLLLLPSIILSIRVVLMSWLFASGGQSIGA